MALGQIGFLTNVLEALATAVGAGMLLGSFGAGAVGLLIARPRRPLEARVVRWGYHGGIVGVLLAASDSVTRYGS